ncbi:MAG: hypothetical protein P1P89_17420 [Desulfobacterales bacterium]|nr:hypothetical protein [Desulfobacterales bacterium]
MNQKNILDAPLHVINIGLEGFAQDLRAAGIDVIQLDWRPPIGGNTRLAALLANLDDEN